MTTVRGRTSSALLSRSERKGRCARKTLRCSGRCREKSAALGRLALRRRPQARFPVRALVPHSGDWNLQGVSTGIEWAKLVSAFLCCDRLDSTSRSSFFLRAARPRDKPQASRRENNQSFSFSTDRWKLGAAVHRRFVHIYISDASTRARLFALRPCVFWPDTERGAVDHETALNRLGMVRRLVWSLVYVSYFGVNLFRAVTATSPKSHLRSAFPT